VLSVGFGRQDIPRDVPGVLSRSPLCRAGQGAASGLGRAFSSRLRAVPAAPAGGGGVRGWGRDGLGTGRRGGGARARRALMLTTLCACGSSGAAACGAAALMA